MLGVRLAAAWLAGINRMRWSTFAFWTALGGVAWATTVGLAADLLGPIAEQVFRAVGVVGVAVGAAAALAYVAWLRSRARSNGLPVPGSEPSA